jgi:hypothetical protein
MGWSLNALVVTDLPLEQVAQRLNHRVSDELVDADDATAGSRAAGPAVSTGPAGSVVVVDPHLELVDVDGPALSAGGVTVHQVVVEEHVMTSAATCWSDGSVRWSVVHEAEQDLLDLRVTGTPPSSLDGLRTAAVEQTRDGGVDALFEVPVALVEAETGFRHDTLPLDGEPTFRPLLPLTAAPPPQPPRRRWFRRSCGQPTAGSVTAAFSAEYRYSHPAPHRCSGSRGRGLRRWVRDRERDVPLPVLRARPAVRGRHPTGLPTLPAGAGRPARRRAGRGRS